MSSLLDAVIPDEFVDWAEAHGACTKGVKFARAKPRRWRDLKLSWRGWCAVALARRGAALDDPLLVGLIEASDYPSQWRVWCAVVAVGRTNNAEDERPRG